MTLEMRFLALAALMISPACGKDGTAPVATGSGSSAAPGGATPQAVIPPGIGGPRPTIASEQGFRILPPQRFRHSSVRGDFRVYETSAGIVASWKTLLSARTLDGKLLWRKEDQGRAVAVSPDRKRIVTNNDDGELLVLDASTGATVAGPVQLGGPADRSRDHVWVSAFAWMPDGKHIVALDSKHVYVLASDGRFLREIEVACKEDCFYTSAIGVTNDEAIVTNSPGSSGSTIVRIKIRDGSTIASADYYGADLDLSRDRTRVIVDGGMDELAMFETSTLKRLWSVPLPGHRGVKASAGASGYIQWKSVPKLSPDGRYVVVNDVAGRLWLLDATDGSPLLAYPTELVDFVEDVIFLADGSLIAIDNPGRVLRLAGTPAEVVWAEMDGPEGGRWDEPDPE